ncbi:MAG: DUF6607 family protein [Saprospiraceae bacterium]|nr:DUF6607 family protein [Saprospiraceae bacterium]
MKKSYLVVLLSLFSLTIFAQKSKDIEAIKGQCGCFDIVFKYAETFSPDTAYKFHPGETLYGREWIFVVEESPKKVVIEHLLVMRDSMVIKHWREDWTYQDPHLLAYYATNDFRYVDVKNQNFTNGWTQRVYGTQDEPRYAGFGEWAHINGKSVWESRADAALPRREYTHRSDYNVMNRGNRIHITAKGYLHEQDNDKIKREEGKPDVLIASEKGYNDYVRIDASKCQAGQKWWDKSQIFWKEVRAAWADVEEKRMSFKLKDKVDDQRIMSHIYDLEKDKSVAIKDVKSKMMAILEKFVEWNDKPQVNVKGEKAATNK